MNDNAAERRAAKREYDMKYRAKNKDMLKEKKAAYYKRTHDPEKERIVRKKRAHLHAEYCRRPEYRKWKVGYDRIHRAKKFYGELWEVHLLEREIREECLSRQTDYEIRLANGTLNKTQRRKRDVRKQSIDG